MIANCTVYFEDHGQAFQEWEIEWHNEALGIVTDCKPLQGNIWIEKRVLHSPEQIKAGLKIVVYSLERGDHATIEYPVRRVIWHVRPDSVGSGSHDMQP